MPRTISPENLAKLTASRKGIPSWNAGLKGYNAGKKHYLWKGNSVGYRAVHSWIARKQGKAESCAFKGILIDGVKKRCKGRYEWSNISGEYKRELNDWQTLCVLHHRKLDNGKLGETK